MTLIELEQAVNHLKQGEVIAYPTEAVWGLGCDPFQQTAFDKILTLKQRPIEKGVILLSDNIERVEPFVNKSLIHGKTKQSNRQLHGSCLSLMISLHGFMGSMTA